MSKLKVIFLFLACLSLYGVGKAQNWQEDPTYSDDRKHKEFMVNMTPLVSQFVPFNASNITKLGIYDYQFRRLKNGKGFRWGLGANVTPNFNSDEEQFFALRFGYIRKKQVGNRVHFTRAIDINLWAEDDLATNRKLGFVGLGPSFSIGIEYSLTKNIALSTEGSLMVGFLDFVDDGPMIRFSPPTGLFLHIKF